MSHSLILGGTKGIGLALARESEARGIVPIVTGRSVKDPRIASSLPRSAVRIALNLIDDESIAKASSLVEHYATDYFFWNAGIWPGRIPFRELSLTDINNVIATNFTGALTMLHRFHKVHFAARRPYHLIAISSVSAWRNGNHETAYCGSKSAQATFAVNFAAELAEDMLGSHTTIVYPGGTKTEIFGNTGEDISGYMDSSAVAKVVWDEVLGQKEICREVHITRDKARNDGSFTVTYGPKSRCVR